jgi:hypothetical protein
MRASHSFTATIHRLGILYCVDVPCEVSRALGGAKYIPVAGTVNEAPFRALLVPRGDGCHRLFLDTKIRRAARADAGSPVQCTLRPDRESRELPIPDDFLEAFADEPGTRQVFLGLTQARRREMLMFIEKARRAETRAVRIARLIGWLREQRRPGRSP